MNSLHIKEWWHRLRPRHSFSWEIQNLIHDRAFWLVMTMIGVIVLMTLLIAFGMWSSHSGASASGYFYRYTF